MVLETMSEFSRRPRHPSRLVSKDDLVDALVLAWTALRIYKRQAHCLPARPRRDDRGLRMEIWF